MRRVAPAARMRRSSATSWGDGARRRLARSNPATAVGLEGLCESRPNLEE
jgi:hypothetical protein